MRLLDTLAGKYFDAYRDPFGDDDDVNMRGPSICEEDGDEFGELQPQAGAHIEAREADSADDRCVSRLGNRSEGSEDEALVARSENTLDVGRTEVHDLPSNGDRLPYDDDEEDETEDLLDESDTQGDDAGDLDSDEVDDQRQHCQNELLNEYREYIEEYGSTMMDEEVEEAEGDAASDHRMAQESYSVALHPSVVLPRSPVSMMRRARGPLLQRLHPEAPLELVFAHGHFVELCEQLNAVLFGCYGDIRSIEDSEE
jgi:hypothetical protein